MRITITHDLYDGDSYNLYLDICASIKQKSIGLIERKTNNHQLISKNKIVFCIFIFNHFFISQSYLFV